MKLCSRCKTEKDESEFCKDRQNNDGLRCYCRACGKLQCEAYHKKNPTKRHDYNIAYYQANKEKMVMRAREYKKRPGIKEKIREYTKEYYRRPEVKSMPSLKEYRRKYYSQEHVRGKQSVYSKLPETRKRVRERTRKRRIIDPHFRFISVLRSHIAGSLKGAKGRQRWEALVGYSTKELKMHLERQFKSEMTWDNYGEWHVDHIIPVSAFNFSGPEDYDFKRCWSLNNLRPLWAFDNISKGSKVAEPFQPCLL